MPGQIQQNELQQLAQNIQGGNVNYYEVLGLTYAATPEEIKQAYKTKALLYHPDKNDKDAKEAAELIFKFLGKAYETLLDSTKRREYNQNLPRARVFFTTETPTQTQSSYPFIKTSYGKVPIQYLQHFRHIYQGGVLTDEHINLFMPETLYPSDIKGMQYIFSLRNFDYLKFDCNTDNWSPNTCKTLTDWNRRLEISFKYSDFSNSRLANLDIPDFFTDFTGAKFIGTDLSNTYLRGNLSDTVFDRKTISSAMHIGLEDEQRFYISHRGELVSVTPKSLLEAIKQTYKKSFFFGGTSLVDIQKEAFSPIQFIIRTCKFMSSGSDLEKAWDSALDNLAHEQSLSLGIKDDSSEKRLQIESRKSTSSQSIFKTLKEKFGDVVSKEESNTKRPK